MREEIVDLIIATARELGDDVFVAGTELSGDTVLFGDGGALDSMGLVTLIVAVEQAIEDKYDASAGLANEKAMSQSKSPYRTIGTLADYAASQLQGG